MRQVQPDVPRAGRDVAEGRQHETTLMIAGVGKRQRPGVQTPATERQQIKIDHARTPANGTPPPQAILDIEEQRHERLRRAPRRQPGYAIEERSLLGAADGVAAVERRHVFKLDSVGRRERAHRPLDGNSASAQVGPKGHIGGGARAGGFHFPSGIIPARSASVVSTEIRMLSDGN